MRASLPSGAGGRELTKTSLCGAAQRGLPGEIIAKDAQRYGEAQHAGEGAQSVGAQLACGRRAQPWARTSGSVLT
jgi:hypothetical protein